MVFDFDSGAKSAKSSFEMSFAKINPLVYSMTTVSGIGGYTIYYSVLKTLVFLELTSANCFIVAGLVLESLPPLTSFVAFL